MHHQAIEALDEDAGDAAVVANETAGVDVQAAFVTQSMGRWAEAAAAYNQVISARWWCEG